MKQKLNRLTWSQTKFNNAIEFYRMWVKWCEMFDAKYADMIKQEHKDQ